uniref:Probable 2-oxoglutarate-dependent dioxygenase AOP1 n=1 Tax=Tanacetum cinerariifolium TaxID=118510 RepID=A0A699IWD5_TANCI|nr:probable 2-oxoglutarate-dependent dioxygenase AOP1 [Tanacetum cinerariifolium]
MASLPPRQLPVIDLSVKNSNSSSSSWAGTCAEVRHALEEYGCFIALYDAVSRDLHDAAFVASQEVHDLPVEVKVRNALDATGYGYSGEKLAKMPLYQRLSIEDAATAEGTERFTKLLWPSGNDTFCESVLMFSKAAAELEQNVMKMVAKSYGIEKHYESLLGSTTYILKFNKCLPPQKNEKETGVASHRDKSFMTVIHQEEEGKSLQIQAKDGEWIEVDLSPSTFIVMAGDVCMAWSNGRIQAPYHKVMMQGNKERYSLVLSSFIRGHKIEVPKELIDEDHPLQFKAFDHYEYIQYVDSNTIQGIRVQDAIKSYCGI